jgi:hypothetical protein
LVGRASLAGDGAAVPFSLAVAPALSTKREIGSVRIFRRNKRAVVSTAGPCPVERSKQWIALHRFMRREFRKTPCLGGHPCLKTPRRFGGGAKVGTTLQIALGRFQ